MKSNFEIMKEWREENRGLFLSLVGIGAVAVLCLVLMFAL